MRSFEYEKEFNLTPIQAYNQILLWLASIKARIRDYNKPFKINAIHGSFWKDIRDPKKRKALRFTITPLEPKTLGVKIHLKVLYDSWRRKEVLNGVRPSWDHHLFSQLWAVLDETKNEDILWQIKIAQFVGALPEVKNESDFKRFMRKLCKNAHVLHLSDATFQQLTEALKLKLLTVKIFAPSKKEKMFQFVEALAKSVFGEALTDSVSGALRGLVEYITK